MNVGTCYLVTAAWLQERYELERALQFALDRCEAQAGATGERRETWIRPATLTEAP